MKIIGILILVIAQAWFVVKWLCEMAVHYAIVKPLRHYRQSRQPVWHTADPMPYRAPDGTPIYRGEFV